MEEIFLNIAGFNIHLKFLPHEAAFLRTNMIEKIKTLYVNFLLQTPPRNIDCTIEFQNTTNLGLIKQKKKIFSAFCHEVKTDKIITFYHLSSLQFQIIIRKILEKLLAKNAGFFLHASAIKFKNGACIFVGSSGSGKSTVISLLDKKFVSLADDSVIIKKENGQFYVYQTPFLEKNNWFSRGSEKYILQGVFFLIKSNYCKIKKLKNKKKFLDGLIKQLLTEPEYLKQELKYIFDFVTYFNNFYQLFFTKNKKKLNLVLDARSIIATPNSYL